MKVREVADVLGLKIRTIRKWIDIGVLPANKIGRCLIIPDDIVFSKEVQERANKSREHSRRIKESAKLGMLARGGKNPEEPV